MRSSATSKKLRGSGGVTFSVMLRLVALDEFFEMLHWRCL